MDKYKQYLFSTFLTTWLNVEYFGDVYIKRSCQSCTELDFINMAPFLLD